MISEKISPLKSINKFGHKILSLFFGPCMTSFFYLSTNYIASDHEWQESYGSCPYMYVIYTVKLLNLQFLYIHNFDCYLIWHFHWICVHFIYDLTYWRLFNLAGFFCKSSNLNSTQILIALQYANLNLPLTQNLWNQVKVICNTTKSHIWGYTCVILTQCKVLI